MKSFRSLIYWGAICSLVCFSCKDTQNNDPKQEDLAALQADVLPEGVIPFHYLNDTLKMIMIDAVLNGTDSITLGWDTGAGATYIPLAFQDSLEGKDSITINLGGQTVIYREKINFSDKKPLENGDSIILANWDLFRDQIVEVSYDRKFLRVLNSTDRLDEYECIPYKYNAKNGHLYIPISVCIQGKVFHIEDALIDTGFNVAFVVYEKDIPGIDFPPRKELPKEDFRIRLDRKILADTIKAAGVFTTDMDIHIATPNPKRIGKMEYPNLLGNEFFSHFSVVFDFKNQNLYLKPLT